MFLSNEQAKAYLLESSHFELCVLFHWIVLCLNFTSFLPGMRGTWILKQRQIQMLLSEPVALTQSQDKHLADDECSKVLPIKESLKKKKWGNSLMGYRGRAFEFNYGEQLSSSRLRTQQSRMQIAVEHEWKKKSNINEDLFEAWEVVLPDEPNYWSTTGRTFRKVFFIP